MQRREDNKQEEPFVGAVERASLDNLLTDWRNVLHSVYVDRWLNGQITTSEFVSIVAGPCCASLEAKPHTKKGLQLLHPQIFEQTFGLISKEPQQNKTPDNAVSNRAKERDSPTF